MPTRIEKLANNSTMYYRGDTCIEISPFTNYYMFTIYRESNDELIDDHIPLNLTNLGTIWMSFISGETKVRIPNYTEAENVDMANGEVVFRINEEDANRILSLGNNTFYISSAIVDRDSSSDETVLFSGSWNEYSLAMKSSLTETIESLNKTIRDLQEQITTKEESNKVKIDSMQSEIDNLKGENERLNAQILDLENQLASIGADYIDATIVSDESDRFIPKTNQDSTKTNKYRNVEEKAENLIVSSLNSTFNYDITASHATNASAASASAASSKTANAINVSSNKHSKIS